MRLAAIDLGTVTSRLLVADIIQGKVREQRRSMVITHLGEDLHKTDMIGKKAIDREVDACKAFLSTIQEVEEADGHPVERIYAIATSAMRDAKNREEVLERLHEAGVDIKVISGQREAQLSFRGAISGFSQERLIPGKPVVTIDVGGGSTEVILGLFEPMDPRVQILDTRSFDIGSRRVTDSFIHADPPAQKEISQARSWITAQMSGYLQQLRGRPQAVIAVAGTATTAVTVVKGISEYDPWKVHGTKITAHELDWLLAKLSALDLKERSKVTGLEPGRAPVIVGGLLVLQCALDLLGLNAFIVSETDILQGLLLDGASHEER